MTMILRSGYSSPSSSPAMRAVAHMQLSGEENWLCVSGTFRNDEYGEYQLHVMKKGKKFIVVHSDEGVLAFSFESDETTESLYEYFIEQREALS